MIARILFLSCSLPLCICAAAQDLESKLSKLHDGRWSVFLACPDTKDKSGLVKGYEYTFQAVIDGGRFHGQFGATGKPDSVIYVGTVLEDGTLKIDATGNTGKSDFAVGKVAQGTAYSYKLLGRLSESSGHALRTEVRRCTATLTRQTG